MINVTSKVKLRDLVEAMDTQTDYHIDFINIKSGEIVSITNEIFNVAEDTEPFDNKLPDWQQEELKLAHEILDNENQYIELPSKFDINEYKMMEDFCYNFDNSQVQSDLLQAIRGRGAFRRFKDKLIKLGLDQEWFNFRDERYKEIAIELCNNHDLEYED
ncbi:UPF0158 family protein [Alkalibacillus haloalkaliphilus]|uniref:UPF0158 family protein n=1 Tax=Alkalibacillus haloalkaliphilus TaxID=94136 RepID=UPI0011BF8433|nr:UPF0158 family protein [Alkalibacillus haloalkaliphilus]